MRSRPIRLILLATCLCAPVAQAGDQTRPATARHALTELGMSEYMAAGDFAGAADMASGSSEAADWVMGADALNKMIILRETESEKDTAREAMALARRALETNPGDTEARLQYAMALGLRTRATGVLTILRKRLTQKTYIAIAQACEARPDDPRPHVLMGSWHLSVVDKAGEGRARRMFGASYAEGMAAFETALELDPENTETLATLALVRLAFDGDPSGEAVAILDRIAQAPAANPYQARMKAKMAPLLDPALEDEVRESIADDILGN